MLRAIKKILLTAGFLVLILLVILLVRTYSTPSWPSYPVRQSQISPIPDSAALHLAMAVRIPTISYSDTAAIDTAVFNKFDSFLVKTYPRIHQTLTRTRIHQFSYIYRWQGTDTSASPMILMGHYDVVPVEQAVLDQWTFAPFSGTITDTCIWGRGAVDDKSGVISILEAVEDLLRNDLRPRRTIYLCFGHDEEVGGTRGAAAIVQYLQQQQVHPALVLDEGGEIAREKMKDIPRPVAVIAIAEKGDAAFELSVDKEGGHSSVPAKETAIDILNAALYRLRMHPVPGRLTPPVREMIQRIGSSSTSFSRRMAANNMWLFEGLTTKILMEQAEGSAMIHTTLVPTVLQSGVKSNVIPSKARAILDSRILPGETGASVEAYIKETIRDPRIQIRRLGNESPDPSSTTSLNSFGYKVVEDAIYKTVPDVLPTPFLGVGRTDSRYYRAISDGVVSFFPMVDGKGFHGINERLPIADLRSGINFFKTIIREN